MGWTTCCPTTTQDMFDLAVDRESRRERQGYVTPAQARAFLQAAREIQIEIGAPPSVNPIARAYFRAIEPPAVDPESTSSTSRRGRSE